ncbi:MAG: fimbrillin family protein [Parabacteroides gordonii]|nr:fimbrillin family protein [Parabacteroides gordonii]
MKTFIPISLILAGFLSTACSSESDPIGSRQDANKPIELAASVQTRATTDEEIKTEPAPAGTYYLGYTAKNGTSPAIGTIEGNDGKIVLNPILTWGQVKSNNKTFTLDNVNLSGEPTYPQDNDILWGKTEGWISTLDFTLEHRMAMVSVELSTSSEDGKNVDLSKRTRISISNVATAIENFNRSTGTVTAADTKNQTLTLAQENAYTTVYTTKPIILPPQTRNDNSKLTITTQSGNKFESSLPEGMIYDTDHHSRAFEFLAGYHLKITATLVSEGASDKISFVAATLENWVDVGTATIGAKEAGIYSVEELQAWVTAYNEASTSSKPGKDTPSLRRYGKWIDNGENGSYWLFSIWKNITVGSEPSFTPITKFYDHLDGHGHTLTGLTNVGDSGALIKEIDGGAKVENLNPSNN